VTVSARLRKEAGSLSTEGLLVACLPLMRRRALVRSLDTGPNRLVKHWGWGYEIPACSRGDSGSMGFAWGFGDGPVLRWFAV